MSEYIWFTLMARAADAGRAVARSRVPRRSQDTTDAYWRPKALARERALQRVFVTNQH